ncbi:formate dehydrogenase subunit gamma [Rhodobacteraceae bacterium CCMM004]|nr:formate dehydrogenase subunit gamma [Rhodobacteraceae bacterium CCMM004]
MSARTSSGIGLFLLVFVGLVAAALIGTAVIDRPEPLPEISREATGGAQTLEDILRRQEGLHTGQKTDPEPNVDPSVGALSTRGSASDPDLWRGLRYDTANVTTQQQGPAATVLIQDGGMRWLEWRNGPLKEWGAWLLIGTLVALALFYLVRGRIRIDGEKTGHKVKRFAGIERFGHWLLAGSFIILGITGLLVLFGRIAIIPLVGRDAYAPIAAASKWVHNSVAWAFMLGLVLVFVMWVIHNLPNRHDLRWLAQGGGLFGGGHPPAKKFNAGQKLIFWSTIVLGASISASGLSLLFPFELPMFAKTFDVLNATGLPELVGFGTLPTEMAPHEEMQLAQLWHSIVAFVFIAIILAHIYLGSIGMEGAFDAMGRGKVELQWAREHHGLWVEELERKGKTPDTTDTSDGKGTATPAE